MRILSLALVVVVACATNPDPRRRTVQAVERTGYGGWIVVTMRDGEKAEGELIAADPSYVHVLAFPMTGPRLVAVATLSITDAEVFAHESEGGFGVWGLIGALSTISHGYFAVISFPVWVLAAGLASVFESRTVISNLGDAGIAGLAKWARFPQGIPAGLDERALLTPRTRLPLAGPPGSPPAATVPDATRRRQAEAWTLTKQAATAGRDGDCATVSELAARIRALDLDFYTTVTARDLAIQRCLEPR
jgi:hypothetical protein